MPYTASELTAEWQYRYEERLAILCEDRQPTPEQIQIARAEADEIVRVLSEEK